MRISTFFYTIKQGLVNIWKNKMFSLASIATMTACIFLFGLFYTIVMNFQSMVSRLQWTNQRSSFRATEAGSVP